MPKNSHNLNSLSRGRVRASMNKYNLFNLYKKPVIRYNGKTLYQQKWVSKAETRAYHGEHLTESRWKTLFTPHLQSVAQLDASLKGLGVEPTPMSLQTYAALEKRLEFAVFRAMFASSVRQARQFILGGHVKVNGVPIKHPSYPLKSGDLFSVNPEKVLLAMGRTKPSLEEAIKTDNKQIIVWNKFVNSAKENPREVWQLKQSKPESLNTIENNKSKHNVKLYNDFLESQMKLQQKETTRENILSSILTLANNKETVDPEIFADKFGKKNTQKCADVYNKLYEAKHELVTESSPGNCKAFISKKSTEFSDDKERKLFSSVKQILSELVKSQTEYLRVSSEAAKLPEDTTSLPFSEDFTKHLTYHPKLNKEKVLEDESTAEVRLPWQKSLFGREDPAKPYFTPWTPRPFIGAFAILPSHIEISFSTCHAVYLRDPVARPGHSEVITPFPEHVQERAYMYYARKGL